MRLSLIPATLLCLCLLPGGAARATGATAQISQLTMQPVPLSLAQNSVLAAQVAALLASQPAALRAHWGISVVDAASGQPLFSENDGQLFAPASNAKLFTTAAALALLGPGYRMSTPVVAEGSIDATGTLHGDLRLIGGGDPTLSGRQYPWDGHTERPNPPLTALDALAAQVAASGIHAVDGPVLADDTLFPQEPYGLGWAWDDLQWEYGAAISALTLNDNVRYLTVTPGIAAGAPVSVAWNPAVAGLPDDLLVSATTSAPGARPALGIDRLPAQPLRIYGTLPAGAAPTHVAIALEDPARFAADAFRASLLAAGVAVSGAASPVHRPSLDTESFTAETHEPVPLVPLPAGATSLAAPAQGRVVAQRQSVPLSAIITVTNKVSQNLHAELLLHLLGRAEGGDGSAAAGARVRRAWLTTAAGVAPDEFLLHDGSGLSADDRVTPRALTTLLHWSTTQPWGPVLRSSLPIGGVDGTLEDRLTGLRGRVQAKTGTLSAVDALSGFLVTDSGRTVIFSILCNDYPGSGSRAILDAIVEATAHAY